jgi:electron transfer flavoprotein-quinone oxidoreductase
VLVIERGNSAGDKNVTGGRLYSYALDLVESGLWQEAALERKVVREKP